MAMLNGGKTCWKSNGHIFPTWMSPGLPDFWHIAEQARRGTATHGIDKHSPCSNIKIAGKIFYVSQWYIKISKFIKTIEHIQSIHCLCSITFLGGPPTALIFFHRHHLPNRSDLTWPRRSWTWTGHGLDLARAPEKMENTCIYCTVYI